MFLFDLLFGKKKPPSAPAPASPAAHAANAANATNATPSSPAAASAPGTAIHHDPALIAGLKRDHELLLEIFGAIGQASKAGDLAGVQKRLEHFRIALQDHLLKENVRLYVYLEHLLRGDPTSHQLMHGFRHEMDDIGRAVVAFLGKYKGIAAHPELAASFANDLAGVGQALAGRIRREEDTLYPMYEAPA